ncbi:FabD/lysophospholipase-like protein [Apiospora phragmitis]|uniref:FabD/lysophospholipase-like protein n=1 Tax=Apiospora phragmitis TaxID=2905665 RepID=A0ABR1WR49_9PEZI
MLKGKGRYQGDRLVEEFKAAAAEFEGNEDATLSSSATSCKVFVCAFQVKLNMPVRLRSYTAGDGNELPSISQCTIWEAARATSAAATYFDLMSIGDHHYVDGATGLNNPVEAVLEEARSLWPAEDRFHSGSGKTVLSSTIIDKLENHLSEARKGALAYFYLSFQDKSFQNLRDLKTSILIQIVSRLAMMRARGSFSYIPPSFCRLRQKYYPSTTATAEDLDKVLRDVLGKNEDNFIVIDTLDKCDTLDDRVEVMDFLSDLVQDSKHHLRVFVTSRPEHDIMDGMTNLKVSKTFIPFDTKSVNRDIQKHLSGLIPKAPFNKWDGDIQNEVITGMASFAGLISRFKVWPGSPGSRTFVVHWSGCLRT